MGTILKPEWDNFCKAYSLSNEKEKGLQHLLFEINENTRIDERKLAEKAKVLKFLKATSQHKLSIEDAELKVGGVSGLHIMYLSFFMSEKAYLPIAVTVDGMLYSSI